MTDRKYDFIIIGAGVSGGFIAHELQKSGAHCLLLEAGKHYKKMDYPTDEMQANAQLYWGGGIELNKDANLGLLRPKCVGGGSLVNQALVDRFDETAFDLFQKKSGIDYFNTQDFDSFYQKAEQEIAICEISRDNGNHNADIFKEGLEQQGYRIAPLRRAQKDCRYQKGNDCINCLSGCKIASKQSSAVTVIPKAIESGLKLIDCFQVDSIEEGINFMQVHGRGKNGSYTFHADRIVLASGAIGNSTLLMKSKKIKRPQALGQNFYCHPQYMSLALYDREVSSFKGAFQCYKSDDMRMRTQGFKLENVFAPPVAISMLLPFYGKKQMNFMSQMKHMACIEVCTRDEIPGQITLSSYGTPIIKKQLAGVDLAKKKKGLDVIKTAFQKTGAREIIEGQFAIGLHLMGGCSIGIDPSQSVVNPNFQLHTHEKIILSDSSIFPCAPGINPSLSIMATSKMAAAKLLGGHS